MSDARLLDDAPWLKSGPAARVLELLNGDGEEARVVGGAVRNALLMLPTGDIDIATTALPAEVIRRAKAAGVKSVPTGIEHGTVTLVVDGQPFEVTTLREDVETFGRKAKVAFGRDWVRDAERRDFTINGLSVDAGGVVHDHVGGLDDLARKTRALHRRSRRAHRRRLSAHPAVLPHPRRLWRRRTRSRRIPRLHCRPRRTCEPFRRARAHGDAEADDRARRRRRDRGDGGRRIAAADFGRRRLYRAVCRDGSRGARARTCAGPGSPARCARGRRHRGRQNGWRRGCGSPMRNQGAGFDGPSLVAARRHGRGDARGGGSIGSARTATATG